MPAQAATAAEPECRLCSPTPSSKHRSPSITTMSNFLKNLAALAIRTQVISTLRAQCPPELKIALEDLLAHESAVAQIQNLVAANLKTPEAITGEAILALDLPERAYDLLHSNPELLAYLVSTARAKLGA